MTAQRQSPGRFGLLPSGATSSNAQALNTANTWLAFSFVPDITRTFNEFRFNVSAVAGSLASTDITVDLYSDSAGKPNVSIEGPKTVNVTGAGWFTATGFSTSCTGGTPYWCVIKNVNGTPASNNCTIAWVTGLMPLYLANISYGFNETKTTTGAGGFATATTNISGPRFGFADGYMGQPFSTIGASADLVYGVRESGVVWTSPANSDILVKGIAFTVRSVTGSPVGPARFGLRVGADAAVYTNSPPNNNPFNTNDVVTLYFSSNVRVRANTVCRATLADASGNSDTSSNAYKLVEVTMDSDSNSAALMPFLGTAMKTYTTDGTNFTDTATAIFPFELLLDTDGPFPTVATGGGVFII